MKSPPAIPILDMSHSDSASLSHEFVDHLSTVGFVYLVNHGIPKDKILSCREGASDFFERDIDFKMGFEMLDHLRPWGYKPFESERFNPEQKLKDAKESVMFDAHDPTSNTWPTPKFEETAIPLMMELGKLARRLLGMIGVGLDLENPDHFLDAHSFQKGPEYPASTVALRINHYPLLEENGLKEGQLPCSEHCDWGTVTLLIQDDVPGLEVQTKEDGAFVQATPLEDSILVNIGLMLENWTDGRLRATKHRVANRLDKERMSVVFFVQPDSDVSVEPLEELKVKGRETNYVATNSGDFVKLMLSRTT